MRGREDDAKSCSINECLRHLVKIVDRKFHLDLLGGGKRVFGNE